MVDTDIIISKKIHIIRGQKVMLDFDLAELYGTETKRLVEVVKRNLARFPDDFMFELNEDDSLNLRSQSATSSFTPSYGGRRYKIKAFTELGVAMLSSVLRTETAVQVNIQIMRTFQKLRELMLSNQELKEKIEILEGKYDTQFGEVFEALRDMLEEYEKPKEPFGFRTS